MASFLMILLMLVSMLLTLVILIQRGRGGGLAGAFGGMGGQSAFGTKAGDVFTRITIVLITLWVLLAGTSGVLARRENQRLITVPAKNDKGDKGSKSDATGSDLKMPNPAGDAKEASGKEAATSAGNELPEKVENPVDSRDASESKPDDKEAAPKVDAEKPAEKASADDASKAPDEKPAAADGK